MYIVIMKGDFMNYTQVPNIITGKDLDYLLDMFNWNYGAYKSIYNSIDKVNDTEIKAILESGANLFDDNMNEVLDILGGTDE